MTILFAHQTYLPPPVEGDPSNESIQQGPLTFNLNPPQAKEEGSPLAATADQAELMCWHYRLGHLTFDKLKQLALNGKISKKLAHIKPPKSAGCLFGAMTKIPFLMKSLLQPSRGIQSQLTK